MERQTPPGSSTVAPAIDWDTLLDRPPVPVVPATLAESFAGRRIVITGAAGSLGQALACCIADYQPAALTLLDSSESGLFALRERLLAAGYPEAAFSFRLADVRRRRRIATLFAAARPEIVYHLAAYKHVPWAEHEPGEYLDANLGGGQVVIEEAASVGASRLIYPSTDKAVNPPSLYGATKRIIEARLREVSANTSLQSVATRFVNVLGTQGSVGVTFARQIAAGQPLSLTDPAMARYWIAPQHGTLLLAYAAAPSFSDPFTILLPDARPEVSVLAIAQRIWRALGKTGEPPVIVTGTRPGERLHEELVGEGESFAPAPFAGILQVRGMGSAPSGQPIATGITALLAAIEAGTPESELKAQALSWARTIR